MFDRSYEIKLDYMDSMEYEKKIAFTYFIFSLIEKINETYTSCL